MELVPCSTLKKYEGPGYTLDQHCNSVFQTLTEGIVCNQQMALECVVSSAM